MNMLLDFARIGAIAGAVSALATIAGRYGAIAPRVRWATALAFGYIAGHLAVSRGGAGWLTAIAALIRPHEARDWLPLAVLAAAGVTVIAALTARRTPVVVFAALLCIGIPARLLAGSIYVLEEWSAAEKVLRLAILATMFGAVWCLLAKARSDEQPAFRAALLILVAMIIAATLALAGTLVYGQLCIAVAAALTGAFVCDAPFQRAGRSPAPDITDITELDPLGAERAGPAATAGGLTMSLGSMIMLAHFYAELSMLNAILLVLALVAAGGQLPFLRRTSPPVQVAIRSLVTLIPAGIALVSTYAAITAEAASPY